MSSVEQTATSPVSYTHLGVYKRQVYKDYQLAENGDNEKKVKGWFYYGVVKVEGKKADETTTTYYLSLIHI